MAALSAPSAASGCTAAARSRRAAKFECSFRLISRPNVGGASPVKQWRPDSKRAQQPLVRPAPAAQVPSVAADGVDLKVQFKGVHHVALICANLENSLEFYQGILGLTINPDRPHDRLPYRGAWLWIGPEMIHLMELPNPDPISPADRPKHGGRDRHFCIGVESIEPLAAKLEMAGVPYTKSMSGRPAVFFRDPDMNCLECVEMGPWR
jgi:glyoxylase I family protein